MALLPIFPLNTVLFPGGLLPLHIFEPRYQLMIGECIEHERQFGVVLIRSGREVGGNAEPFEVGTTARITRFEQLPGGRLNIVVAGSERFRILSTDSSMPYLQAEIELAPRDDSTVAPDDELLGRVRGLFERLVRTTFALGDQWAGHVGLPTRPARLVDFVAARLEIPTEIKQNLLEADEIENVLATEAEILDEVVERLERRLHAAQYRKLQDFGRLN